MSSIQVASEKTVRKGRVAPQAISAPKNSEHWKSNHHKYKLLRKKINYKSRGKTPYKGAAVTSIKTNLPAFTIEFDDTVLFMGKIAHQFFNELIIFSVHSNREVVW